MATVTLNQRPYSHLDLGNQVWDRMSIFVDWPVQNLGLTGLVSLKILANGDEIGSSEVTMIRMGFTANLQARADLLEVPVPYKAVLFEHKVDRTTVELESHDIVVNPVSASGQTAISGVSGIPPTDLSARFTPDQLLFMTAEGINPLDPEVTPDMVAQWIVDAGRTTITTEVGWTEEELAVIEQYGLINPTKDSVRNMIDALKEQALEDAREQRIETELRQQQQRELDIEEEKEFARAQAELDRQAKERARIRQEEDRLQEEIEEARFQAEIDRQKKEEADRRREEDAIQQAIDDRKYQEAMDKQRRAEERREQDRRQQEEDDRRYKEAMEAQERENRRAERELEEYREQLEYEKQQRDLQRAQEAATAALEAQIAMGADEDYEIIDYDWDDDDDDDGYRGGSGGNGGGDSVEKVSGTSSTYEAKSDWRDDDWGWDWED